MGYVASKWSKTKVLLRDKELSKNVPETRLYNKSTLRTMLERYKMVYVKPTVGMGGNSVMRVEKTGGRYKYQINTSTRTFYSFDSLASCIDRIIKSRSYIIQRGIHLLKYNGRYFDLRVMVQKNPKGTWETTGVIGRLGHINKIVTNVGQGGRSVPVETLLGKHVTEIKGYKQRLMMMGESIARQLERSYPRLNEIGVDIGVDSELNVWILEANTQPAIYGFKSLKDRSIYQKIYRYQKAYVRK